MPLSRGSKLALVLAVTLFAALAAGIALAGSAVRRAGGGPVRIAVHEKNGDDFRIAVPGFVVGLALTLAPRRARGSPPFAPRSMNWLPAATSRWSRSSSATSG